MLEQILKNFKDEKTTLEPKGLTCYSLTCDFIAKNEEELTNHDREKH